MTLYTQIYIGATRIIIILLSFFIFYGRCNFVTVWPSNVKAIKVQLFNDDFSKLGGEFFATDGQRQQALYTKVAAITRGYFVVVWCEYNDYDINILAQTYKNDGTPYSDRYIVNEITVGQQYRPAISPLTTKGRFVVTWSSSGGDTSSYGIKAKVMEPDGSRVTAEKLINTIEENSQSNPVVITLKNKNLFFTYTSRLNEPTNDVVLGKMMKSDLVTIVKDEWDIQQDTLDSYFTKATALYNGGFVVVWEPLLPAGQINIFFRIYNDDGNPLTDQRKVNNNTITQHQRDPSIETLKDGRFVISWTNHDPYFSVINMQIYFPDGTRDGNIQVAVQGPYDMASSVIIPLFSGGFVLIWSNDGKDGDEEGIFGQMFLPNGQVDSIEYQINTLNATDQKNAHGSAFWIKFDYDKKPLLPLEYLIYGGISIGFVVIFVTIVFAVIKIAKRRKNVENEFIWRKAIKGTNVSKISVDPIDETPEAEMQSIPPPPPVLSNLNNSRAMPSYLPGAPTIVTEVNPDINNPNPQDEIVPPKPAYPPPSTARPQRPSSPSPSTARPQRPSSPSQRPPRPSSPGSPRLQRPSTSRLSGGRSSSPRSTSPRSSTSHYKPRPNSISSSPSQRPNSRSPRPSSPQRLSPSPRK